jgi:hypothetical protein
MRIATSFLLLTFGVAAASAQSATPCNGFTHYDPGHAVYVDTRNDHPLMYTAKIRQSFEQTLADGNTIRSSSENIEARDADGRTLWESVGGCWQDQGGQPQLRLQFMIEDNKNRSDSSWTTGPGSFALVRINHYVAQDALKDVVSAPGPTLQTKGTSSSEDLGTKTIAGLTAKGKRLTETIPAGQVGNDAALVVTHDTWTVAQPRITVMAVDDDPRTGKHTWEVTSFQKGDPDPALFTPPASYKNSEMRTQTVVTPASAGLAAAR